MTRCVFLAVLLLIFPPVVHADDFRKVSVTYYMDAEVLDTPYPHVIWEGSGLLRYKWEKDEGRIVGGDIPVMTQYCPVDIPGYYPLMLAVRGTPGSVAIVKSIDDHIVVSGVSLDLDVLDGLPMVGVTVPPPRGGRPLLHLTFPDLRMTTGKITAEDKRLEGKIDLDAMSAELVFTTSVPKTGNEKLDHAIAGKTVAGRFRISLQNPYQKK